jgi:hypothetical protein
MSDGCLEGRDVFVKAELLSFGVQLTSAALANYGKPYLMKRRAYGNSDPLSLVAATLPQEMVVTESRLVCAVNIRPTSPWKIDFIGEQFVLIRQGMERVLPLDFPRHPRFYDEKDDVGFSPASVVTLYGGAALGIFVYGDCTLVSRKQACHYCSIEPNRSRNSAFLAVISPSDVEKAIRMSLAVDEGQIKQIMLNGGNFPDLDKSFGYYISIVEAARRAVDASGKNIPIHLIAFPPKKLQLIKEIADFGVEVAFNTEVYDEDLFEKYCPGKFADGGHKLLFSAMEEAVHHLGKGRVFSIFVGGLEPLASLNQGMEFVSALGVTPVINVFHADPETPLADYPMATSLQIMAMGKALQNVYEKYQIGIAFYADCGRNSIDHEALSGCF